MKSFYNNLPTSFLRHHTFKDWELVTYKIGLEDQYVKIDLMVDSYYVSLFLSKYIQILTKKIFESLLR